MLFPADSWRPPEDPRVQRVSFAVDNHMLTALPDGHSYGGTVSFRAGGTKITLTGKMAGLLRYHPQIEIRLDERVLGLFADTSKINEPRLRSAVEFALEAMAETARMAAIENARVLTESKRKVAAAARAAAIENDRALKESLRKI